jgi:hypothetical protein
MKSKLYFFIFLLSNIAAIQSQSSEPIDGNGFNFEVLQTGTNTKYTEVGSGFFKNKFIMVSSKKIGGFAKIDPNTDEAYKEFFV